MSHIEHQNTLERAAQTWDDCDYYHAIIIIGNEGHGRLGVLRKIATGKMVYCAIVISSFGQGRDSASLPYLSL